MRPRSQNDRVLALLREYGDRGLNTVDLHAPACDGGRPILRLAARVHELQARGYRIRSERKLNGTSSYFLVGEPDGAVRDGRTNAPRDAGPIPPYAPAVSQSLGLLGLFDPEPPRGDYRDVEAA